MKYEYEIFLRNGSSFNLKGINNLNIESINRGVSKLEIHGNGNQDKLIFVDIDEIVCIILRKQHRELKWDKWWFKWN